MDKDPHVDFQRTIAQLLEHDIGRRLLALTTPAQLGMMAQEIAQTDLYRFSSLIKAAVQWLAIKTDPDQFVVQHIEHLLWVEHRRALWWSGRIQSPQDLGCCLRVENEEYLAETLGTPTILLTPMTLAYEDALWLTQVLLPERAIAIYGEGIRQDQSFVRVNQVIKLANLHLIGASSAGIRDILRVLKQGGCYLTYPDFVYTGHQVHSAVFLGMPWPFASAFIALCGRPGHVVLPCYIQRNVDELVVRFSQPIEFTLPENGKVNQRWVMHLVGSTVARLLEAMVLSNPAQWLLLSTIVAECQQRATHE